MTYLEQTFTTPDGRQLEVATLGDPSGLTVVFHHGTPGSVKLVNYFRKIADQSSLFFVTFSRPGYGLSGRLEGRSISSVVADVNTALDALGRGDYVAVGWSGGGPHALACAALDAPRCLAAWSIAGVVPVDADIDWTEGMGPENLEEFSLAVEGGSEYEAHVMRDGERFAGSTPENIVELFGGLLSEVDKVALVEHQARVVLADACAHAFAQGYYGFYDDDRAFFSPWGFDPTQIEVPVFVWFGDHDLMVPPSHGQWLVSNLPTAIKVHKPHEGHVSLLTNHEDELEGSLLRAFDGRFRRGS
ncbi:MAG: alpha/beta hydrolase [Acidimicrobiales bacterium]|jgi:pimeloyl-ACP methyl ester carboxylesterase